MAPMLGLSGDNLSMNYLFDIAGITDRKLSYFKTFTENPTKTIEGKKKESDSGTIFDQQTEGIIKINGSFNTSTVGVIYEAAGKGIGIVISINNGELFCSCGKGTNTTSTYYNSVIRHTFYESFNEIVYTMRLSEGLTPWKGSKLFIDGVFIKHDSINNLNSQILAGGGIGGTGTSYSGILGIVPNNLDGNFDIINGEIGKAELWSGNTNKLIFHS